jgi:carbamoyltransferase
MLILGINAYHGDSSAAIVADGKLIAGIEEERFRRIKHWAGFPSEAITYCLKEARARVEDLDHIAISRDPLKNLQRKALYALKRRPNLGWMRNRVANIAKIRSIEETFAESLGVEKSKVRAHFHSIEHHRAHLASTFFVSPFDHAAVASIDGFGDYSSVMTAVGAGNNLRVLDSVQFPHSLGIMYTAVTQYLGFTRYGDEYKVMGLASYGRPSRLDDFRKIVRERPNGRFELDLRFFRHHTGNVRMTWEAGEPAIEQAYSDDMVRLLGPARRREEPLQKYHEDIASSLQARLEEVYFHILNHLYETTNQKSICLAGGVAFNSVANGKIFDRTPFTDVYIQAAAGDAGTALGAAYYVHNQLLKQPRAFEMRSAYWGPEYSDEEIRAVLQAYRLPVEPLSDAQLFDSTARAIADGKVVGWFQGRLEWGPRALGNRSILVDPRRAEMKDLLNERIKRREPFRPFAPSILLERVGDYFEKSYPDPFMIKVYPVKPEKRQVIPAVTHVDGTGRLQTVSRETNPRYWQLIKRFEDITGVPVVLNTSFNENEPVVCTPKEAVECFLRTRMDVLALGNFFLTKERASAALQAAGTSVP